MSDDEESEVQEAIKTKRPTVKTVAQRRPKREATKKKDGFSYSTVIKISDSEEENDESQNEEEEEEEFVAKPTKDEESDESADDSADDFAASGDDFEKVKQPKKSSSNVKNKSEPKQQNATDKTAKLHKDANKEKTVIEPKTDPPPLSAKPSTTQQTSSKKDVTSSAQQTDHQKKETSIPKTETPQPVIIQDTSNEKDDTQPTDTKRKAEEETESSNKKQKKTPPATTIQKALPVKQRFKPPAQVKAAVATSNKLSIPQQPVRRVGLSRISKSNK